MIKKYWDDFKNTYTSDEKLIVCMFASLFLPWLLSACVLVISGLYIFVKKDYKALIKEVKGGKILFLLAIYLFVVSLLHANWIGAAISFGMALLFIILLHYRKHIRRDVFSLLIDLAIVLSLVAVVYGVFEQFGYMSQIDGMGFFDIQNKPEYRVHTFYFNANYYALVILYIECMCIYKFFIHENIKARLYYTLAGVANLFAMFLTGGRIAWLGLAVGVVTMVFVNRWWKMLVAVLASGAGAVGVLALKPGLIPRLASKGFKIERRRQIWQTAWLIVKDHGILGGGPLAYYSMYEGYKDLYIETYGLKSFKQYKLGISAPHSHTIFFEPLVSFGLIGSLLLLTYIVLQLKEAFTLITKKKEYALAAFIFGSFMVTLSFSIMDFPILWHQTGFLMLLLFASYEICKEEK